MWSLQLPGKILNFLWRSCHNVLPTAAELVKQQVDVNILCPLCHVQVEDACHVLFKCNLAREVWMDAGVPQLLKVNDGLGVKEVLKGEFMRSSKQRCVQIGLFCWGLWARRNMWVWEKKHMSTFGLRAVVMSLLQDWQKSQEKAG